MTRRRWVVAAATTLQELDRLLRDRLRDVGGKLPVGIRVDASAFPAIFEVTIGAGETHRSAFLSSAIDQALESHDDIAEHEDSAA